MKKFLFSLISLLSLSSFAQTVKVDQMESDGRHQIMTNMKNFRIEGLDYSMTLKVYESTGSLDWRLTISTFNNRLPVTRLLNLCDNLKIDFFNFVIDPNSISVHAKEQWKSLGGVSEYATIMHDFATMQREMASLKILLEDTKRDIDELNRKLNAITGTNDVRPIAWRTKRIISELAKESKNSKNRLII